MLQLKIENGALTITSHADPLGLELLLEELNKLHNADYASNCRRSAQQFIEAYHYTMLLQEMDQLEELKKKHKENFWKNPVNAERFSTLTDLKGRMDKLVTEIEEKELTLSLMALGQQAYSTKLVGELDDWDNAMFGLKTDIYSTLFPANNQCHFSIFGRHADQMLEVYFPMLKTKGFDAKLRVLWMKNNSSKKNSYDFKEQAFNWNDYDKRKGLKAPGTNFEVVGILGEIKGKLVLPYLEGESGVHKMAVGYLRKPLKFKIEVGQSPIEQPKMLHKQDYLKRSSAIRQYDGQYFKDTRLDINRELAPNQLLDFLLENLEDKFRGRMLLEVI